MSTVYTVGGKIYAVKDIIFGWCLSFDPINWTPIENAPDLELSHLKAAKESFVGPLWPQELKDALDAAIVLCSSADVKAKADREIRIEMAEAKAVSGVEEELKKLKWANRQALSRLAILHLRTLEQTKQVKLTISILQDFYLDLEWRVGKPGERYLKDTDCPVTVKRPKEPDLVSLLDGLIPFTD